MNAINLVIDRLHVGYLGCYGNTWIETPHFNRMAAEGFLFDQALIASPDLSAQYAAYMTGMPAQARAAASASSTQHQCSSSVLIARLAAAGVHTALVADDPTVLALPGAESFAEIIPLEARGTDVPADEIEDTNLARYFAVVAEWLQDAPEPFCLWLHCGGLAGPWDAPLALREAYAEEEEPPPYEGVIPPCRLLSPGYDPDELLAIARAYAGQVSLLDLCCGVMFEELDRLPLAERTLLSMTSARGYPLGEHRRVGPIDDALYAEMVHKAWILRLPNGAGAAARTQALVSTGDLAPTLGAWFDLKSDESACSGRSVLPLVQGNTDQIRDRLFIANSRGARAVRTPAWYFYEPAHEDDARTSLAGRQAELYVKPDDRWDLNDVADRCAPVVELFEQLMRDSTDVSKTPEQAPLADALLSGPE